ncbi:MAG: FkbM family methyltransferase [Rhodospirillaceae bacterium]|nr:FkbM family methyltransferase [Rhodospirillales bacterium]
MKISSTRSLAKALSISVRAVAALLGRSKALKVLGHVRYLLIAQQRVNIGGHMVQLAVLDRRGAYWAQDGSSSEPETQRWIESFAANDVLYDVGANIGLYSLYAATARQCRCVALEPNPFSFDGLVRNTLLNGLEDKITALCLALGDERGLFGLGMVSDQSGAVGSTLAQLGDGRTQVMTMVTRLDNLVELNNIPFPNHIKIDVDGIEDLVLAGGKAVLSDNRVKSVLLEVCDRTPEQVDALRLGMEACGLFRSAKDSSNTNWIFRRA